MTRKEFISLLSEKGRMVPIRWRKSGVIEVAVLAPKNVIVIHNVITRKRYTLPKKCNELNVEVVTDTHTPLGALLPKRG